MDLEGLPGATKSTKSRELLIYLQRHDRLSDLISAIRQVRPSVDLSFFNLETADEKTSKPAEGESASILDDIIGDATGSLGELPSSSAYERDVVGLQNELAALRQSVLELHKRLEPGTQDDERVALLQREIERSLNRAVGRTEDLTAALILPEDRTIRLIMEHDVDRLEEYRSDENLAFLMIGLFAGAAVGIVVNWVTDSTFSPTPISITFLILFALLAGAAAYWSYRLKNRVSQVYSRLPVRRNSPN